MIMVQLMQCLGPLCYCQTFWSATEKDMAVLAEQQ